MTYKMTFLGSGSAFTLDNFQSNILLECEGDRLLLDCGSDIRFSLREIGLSMVSVPNIYISHAHSDHSGGLEGVAFSTLFTPDVERPHLYVSRHLAAPLWSDTLAGGLRSIQGSPADIDTYFRVHRIKPNGKFVWHGVPFKIVQSIHIYNGLVISPSYGLMFKIGDQTIFWTSDTQHAPSQLEYFYDMADVIFHDCETSPYPSKVHAHYSELKGLPATTKEKMWLYHYNMGPLPDAEGDGFAGFVEKNQIFEFGGE